VEQVLTPPPIIDQFEQNDVTHVIWLPDSETNFMYELMTREEGLKIVPVCREGESMAIAAGIWVGGQKPVVLIQNTGMFESGDSIRGLGIDLEFPLVMMIGYRGWTRHGITKDSAARFTEPILHAYGINYYLIESNDDVGRISDAFEEAERTRKPVACLLGAEYS
jgi:sulfopyruvate decarboxylase TPP-binding subunit